MLSNRKRKASPDKSPETSKTRKLKVSNKIFRSPMSSKPNSIAKTKISNLLPDGYDSIILTASTKPEENIEGSEAVYGCVRLPILTKEDALLWVKKFETKTSTSYRSQKSWKNDLKAGLFKRTFLCDYQNPDDASEEYSCKACIIFTIKDAKEIETNPDYYLRDYPSQVIIQFCHNHHIEPEEYVKHLQPSTELRAIFDKYFANGHSPFSALICHKCDLHSSYGAEFYDVVSNGAICPSYNWCIIEYEKVFGRRFVEPQEDEVIHKLTGVISQYNEKCDSDCAIFSKDSCYLLSLCTPFMKSVFTSGFAEDLITVRSFCTPKTSPRRQKLILFLCHTPIGSLPFGIVLTFAEDVAVICEGIQALLKMLGAPSYSPKTIITDEHALISKCLKKSFPNSQLVFNEFQMLQSVWRILRLVCEDDNEEFQALYNLFLVTLNSSCEEDFKRNFDSLVIYAERYPKLSNFMKYFKLRANAYVLYARPKIEFNTDVLNYTDSGTIILQDVSIKYSNFFNILQLFDFLIKTYVDHYERKLVKIIEGDLKGFFKTNFYVPLNRIANFTCEKVTETEFVVTLNGIKFFVNAELDTCTCQVGVHGGSCVHQYIVEKDIGLVPECYTPLGDDMLGILKAILSYKQSGPKELGSGGLGSEMETFTGDDVSHLISPAEVDNIGDALQDVENLGPVDEIYLAPSKVTDSFTDDDMTSLALAEFDDSKEANDNCSNDVEQYNSQQISSPVDASNVISPKPSSSVDVSTEKISKDETLPEPDEKKSHSEIDFVVEESVVMSADIEGCRISENTLETGMDAPVVYTYTAEKEDDEEIYGEMMRENDKKTAEIAEFLTNLPDTNNSYCNAPSNNLLELQDTHEEDAKDMTETVQDCNESAKDVDKTPEPTQETEITSEGVVIMKDDDFFTQYKIMENGVLAVVSDTEEEDQTKFQTTSAQNSLGNSYEESNLIVMSSNDLFENDDNTECIDGSLGRPGSRINVLSSVVIKPPSSSSVNQEMFLSQAPLNLNTIKHKTLRSVKQSNLTRASEPESGQEETVSKPDLQEEAQIIDNHSEVHDDSVLKVNSESADENVETDRNKDTDETIEKDVIQLYCTQPENKAPMETKSHCEEQSVEQVTSDSVADGNSDEVKVKIEIIDEEINKIEDINITECDPEQLAKENVIEVIEIDSDDLEELASQAHDTNLSLGLDQEISNEALQKSPLKVVTLKDVPTGILPLKKFSESDFSGAKAMPLRDYMIQISPKKISSEKSDSSQNKQTYSKKENINETGLLDSQINTAFSQLTDLASRSNCKGPVKKFLGKYKELDATAFERLTSAGISIQRVSDLKTKTDVKAELVKSNQITLPINRKIPQIQHSITNESSSDESSVLEELERRYSNTNKWNLEISDDDDDSTSSDSDDFSCTELEHFSDCRTSCSEIHSELDDLYDFSDYDIDESSSPSVNMDEVKEPKVESDSSDSSVDSALLKSKQDYIEKHIRYIKNPFSQRVQWARDNSLGVTSGNRKSIKPSALPKIDPKFQYTKFEQVKNLPIKKEKDNFEIICLENDNKNKIKPGIRASTNTKTKLIKLPKRQSDSLYLLEAEDEKVDTKVMKTSKGLKISSVDQDFVTSKSKIQNSSSFVSGIGIKTTSSNMANLERRNKLIKNNPVKDSFNISGPSRKVKNENKEASSKSLSTLENRSKFYPPTLVLPTETKKFVDIATVNKKMSSTHLKASLPKKQAPQIKTSMTKDAKELESILTDEVDFDGHINNINHPEVKVEETPIFMNDELSFLFNDSRFETIVENSEDFIDEVKTESTNEWDGIDVSDIKVEPCSLSPEYIQYLEPVQIPSVKKSKARKTNSELKKTNYNAPVVYGKKEFTKTSTNAPVVYGKKEFTKSSTNAPVVYGKKEFTKSSTNAPVVYGKKEFTKSSTNAPVIYGKKEFTKSGTNAPVVYGKKEFTKSRRQESKPTKLSWELKELKRLAEVFTREKRKRTEITTRNKAAGRKDSKDPDVLLHSRRVKNITGSKIKDSNVINPLSVVKNERGDRRKTETFDKIPIKKLVTSIKVEKEEDSETPVKREREDRKTSKEKRITKRDEATFRDVPPIKDFKLTYSSPKEFGKIRAVVKPFHKISEPDNSITSLSKSALDQASIHENLQKGQSSFITSTPLKPVGYAEIFKKYLDTSKVRSGKEKTSKTFSQYDDRKGRNLDVDSHIRKRRKSVRSNTSNSTKVDESVIFAGDLIVVKSEESDSDASEVRRAPVVRKRGRPRKERAPSSSENENDNVSRQDSELTNKGLLKKRISSSEKQKRTNNRRDTKKYYRNIDGDRKLVVRLERSKKIELMCLRLIESMPRFSRNSFRERKGYKELLENAKRLKDL